MENRRSALITGSTSGIGEAICERLSRDGLRVVVTGRSAIRGEGVAAKIRAAGGEAHFIPRICRALQARAGTTLDVDGGALAVWLRVRRSVTQ